MLLCLLIGVVVVFADQWLFGLLISVTLLYVALRLVRYRVTVIAAHTPGTRVCVGPATIWVVPLFVGWALLLALLALAPYFSRG